MRIDDLDFKSLVLCIFGNKVFVVITVCCRIGFTEVDVTFDRERLSVDFSFDSCGAVRYAVAVFLRADDDFKRDVVNDSAFALVPAAAISSTFQLFAVVSKYGT